MANVIKHKRGSGSDPGASDLVVGEVAIRTDVGKLFTKMDNGSVAEIAGGGSDIVINTLSSSSATGGGSTTFNGSAYRFTLSSPPSVSAQQLLVSINGVIQKPVAGTGQPSEGFSVSGNDIILGDAPATGADFFILTFKSLGVSEPADNSVTSAKIVDGAIVNADINASAAIAGSKISPSFTSNIEISNSTPTLIFNDTDHENDFEIKNYNGTLIVTDKDAGANRIELASDGTVDIAGNLDANGGLDVTGAITGTGDLTIDTNTLYVDSSNNRVGIGTTSPQKLLDCRGEFTISNNNASYWDFDRDDSDGSLKIKDTGTERLRIDSSGRVLIGHTSDKSSSDTNAILQLFTATTAKILIGRSDTSISSGNFLGIIDFHGTDGTSSNRCARIGAIASGDHSTDDKPSDLVFQTCADGSGTSAERMRIDSSGRLLLGTTTEGEGNADDLTIATSGHTGITLRAGATFQSAIYMSDGTSGNAEYAGYVLYDHNVNALRFGANASERMRIDSSGNVGIGATSITANTNYNTLQIQGQSGNGGGILRLMTTDGSTSKAMIFADTGGLSIRQETSHPIVLSTDNSERMRIDSSGRVLTGGATSSHGSSNADDLQIGASNQSNQTGITLGSASASGIRFADASDDTAGAISYYHSDDTMRFSAGSSERVRIDANGIKFNGDSAAANALNDYEEGTYTPSVSSGLSAGQIAYNSRSGRYTKIGNIVNYTFHINISSASFDDGSLKFGGLPFTAEANDGNKVGFGTLIISNGNLPEDCTFRVETNDTQILVISAAGDAVAANSTTLNNGNRQVAIAGFYYTSS